MFSQCFTCSTLCHVKPCSIILYSNYSLKSFGMWCYKHGILVFRAVSSLQNYRKKNRKNTPSGCVLRVVVLLENEPSPQSWSQECSGAVYHHGRLWTLLHSMFIFPSTLTSSQFLLLKNIPTAWSCHHHAQCLVPLLLMVTRRKMWTKWSAVNILHF